MFCTVSLIRPVSVHSCIINLRGYKIEIQIVYSCFSAVSRSVFKIFASDIIVLFFKQVFTKDLSS